MSNNINERCPLSGECERKKCEHIGHELLCDYYKYNGIGEDRTIQDQEELRRQQDEQFAGSDAETEPGDGEGALLARDFGVNGAPPEEERDLEVIEAEILFFKRQAGQSIIEIGRRLNEAKAQLPHGQWLPWLHEKVDISERSAQDFMRLAREYSESAAIADLGASKALALLALSPSERETFAAEKHAVNGVEKTVPEMTKEELKQAIRERDAALKKASEELVAKEEAARELTAVQAKLDALTTKADGLEDKLKAARDKEKEAKAAAENAKQEKTELEQKLQELRSKPVEVAVAEPDQATLDKLRAEAEAQAAEKLKAANDALSDAQAQLDTARREAERLQKELAAADKDTQAFRFFFDEWQHKYNAMLGALAAVETADPEKAGKLRGAVSAVLEKWRSAS